MSDNVRRRGRIAWVAGIVCVLSVIAGGTFASAQTLTGVILGKVSDSSDLPLPGVTVTVTSPQLISQLEVRTTNERGEYRFPALPAGGYSVRFELPGFATVLRDGLVLAAGTTATVNTQLGVAGVAETVTVVGASPLVDVRQSARQETMAQEVLENVPVRLYVDAYNLLPGVVDGQYKDVTVGASSVHGSTSKQNRVNLEGASLDDSSQGYPATDVSPEVIQEMQITTSGVSAEFGGAGGAVINVITKSGGNVLSGAVTGFFNNRSLQSDNITDALRAEGVGAGSTELKNWSAGTSLGGPILKNRLWFFGDYQRRERDYTQIGLEFLDTMTERQDLTFFKLTTQLGGKQRLEGFVQYGFKDQAPFVPDIRWKDDKVVTNAKFFMPVANIRWTNALTSNTLLEANASMQNLRWNVVWPNAQPDVIGYMDRSTGDQFGGIYRGHGDPVRRYNRRVKADISHFTDGFIRGSHVIKTGGMFERLITQDERFWGSHGRRLELVNGQPDRVVFSNYPVNEFGTADMVAAYLQDEWSLTPRLTLNLGLRFEHTEYWFPDVEIGGLNFPVQTFPEAHDVASFRTLAPRLGVVYDLFGDNKTVIKANWGLFYDQIASRDFMAAAPFREGTKVYRWLDTNSDLLYQDNELGTLISDSTVPNPSSVDPNLKPSYWRNVTVGVQRELLPGTAVTISGIFKRELDVIETIDAGKPFDDAYLPVTVTNPLDGQPLTVYTLRREFQGLPVQSFITNPGRALCSFCPDPPVLRYKALEVTLNRSLNNRWQFHGSYVWSQAEGNKGTHHRTHSSDVYSNPNNLVYAWGRTSLDRPHQVKLLATVQAPYDIWISPVFVGQSGVPYQQSRAGLGTTLEFTTADSPLLAFERIITVRGEPSGTQRMPTQHLLSVRAEKRFKFGAQRFVGAILDVTNMFNSSSANFMRNVRLGHPDFGKVGEVVQPRTFRLGLRVQF